MKIKEAKTKSAEYIYIVQYFLIQRLYATRSITVSIGILFGYKITTRSNNNKNFGSRIGSL